MPCLDLRPSRTHRLSELLACWPAPGLIAGTQGSLLVVPALPAHTAAPLCHAHACSNPGVSHAHACSSPPVSYMHTCAAAPLYLTCAITLLCHIHTHTCRQESQQWTLQPRPHMAPGCFLCPVASEVLAGVGVVAPVLWLGLCGCMTRAQRPASMRE